MNNPNPFVPKGSILEQQSKRRSRLKLAVFCVLTVSVSGLAVMLIQGCKREPVAETTDTTTPTIDTNVLMTADTNLPPADTNIYTPPVITNTPPPMVVNPPVEPTEAEYTVVKGDFLDSIAKKHGVTLKALEAANPGVVPTKLKVGQKLKIPAGGTTTPAATMDSTGGSTAGEVYVVKSGDTLTKIAKQFGTTYKAIESENNLSTTKIKVGQKLKIPAKAGAVAPTPVTTAPVMPTPVYSEPATSNSVPPK